VERLSEEFVTAAPEEILIMANIQGHILSYKDRSSEAVMNVSEWLEEETSLRMASLEV